MDPRISLVVSAFDDEPAHLREVMESLRSPTHVFANIVVADDGSSSLDLATFLSGAHVDLWGSAKGRAIRRPSGTGVLRRLGATR